MIDLVILGAALLLSAWATWSPRGEDRGWLLGSLALLWAALVGVGLRRGVEPGFLPWLLLLALIGALAGLLVVWSVVTVVGKEAGGRESGGAE